MASIEDIRNERIEKLNFLREKGIDPYPAEVNRTHTNRAFLDDFTSLETNHTSVTLAGRVVGYRLQGALAFIDIFDGLAKTQILTKQDSLGESFTLLAETLDQSDFIEVTGTAFTTNRGVPSLEATAWRMLAKSLRAVPAEHYGIKGDEERYRHRYLDMLLNENVRTRVARRSTFWNAVRTFLLDRGYIEVHTPVIETKTGGAEARPFITHHNALDLPVYLRISHELWHKKLIAGGISKVFEIGQVFRNEGMSHEHAQDYIHCEFYSAFEDARTGIPMLIELYREIAQKTFGTQKFTIHEHEVDLSKEWSQLDYNELMQEHFGFDPRTVDLATVRTKLTEANLPIDDALDIGRGVDLLWKQIRKNIGGPAILTGMPVYLEPLAKKNHNDPRTVDRFQILLGGSEVGKAFNELNDPIDQHERFEHQQSLRDAGDEEAQMADWEYVEAMEYGMPPMFGFGVSERLFAFLEGVSIREAQLFPLMRPK